MSANAQAQSVDEKLKFLLEVCGAEDTIDKISESLRPHMINQIKQSSNKISPAVADHIANIITDEFNAFKPQFTALMTTYYKKHLSEEEIKALYDFYKSPIGSSAGKKMAQASDHILPQMYTFLDQLQPRLQERLSKDEKIRKALSP